MKPTVSFSLFIVFLLLFSGCEFIQKQNEYLAGVKSIDTPKTITLLESVEIEQTRGAIETTYRAFAEAGEYALVFESDAGEFYYPKTAAFKCEKDETGGLFMTKGENPVVYFWVVKTTDEAEFLNNLSDPDFASGLGSFYTEDKLFVHYYYEVSMDIIQ